MVDNKKKVVSGVVAATALTGAFVAPETAQAADNNAPNSNQQQTTQEESSANLATQKVNSAKTVLNDVQAKAKRAINRAENLKKNAQTKVDQYESRVEQAKEDWDTKVITAARKTEEAEKETNENKRIILTNQANTAKINAEKARENYENRKTELGGRQQKLEQKEINLLNVQTEQNKLIEVAQADYDKALMQQQRVIQGATKSRHDDNWGNWTKTHTVEDYLTDDSGFQALIPQFQKLVQKERKAILATDIEVKELDANRLFLKHDHNVRVHFIDEGAGYRNQLAYEATKGDSYEKGMIFNDISCDKRHKRFGKKCELGNDKSKKNDPLLKIGDFVDLGLIEGGTQLNFLLKANGKNKTNGLVYGADASLNNDGLQHMMAFSVQAGGREYLLMGFEDLVRAPDRNGKIQSDEDFNDAMFVVDFGEGNLTTSTKYAQAASVPEASNMAAIFGITGAGLMLRRRRRNKK